MSKAKEVIKLFEGAKVDEATAKKVIKELSKTEYMFEYDKHEVKGNKIVIHGKTAKKSGAGEESKWTASDLRKFQGKISQKFGNNPWVFAPDVKVSGVPPHATVEITLEGN